MLIPHKRLLNTPVMSLQTGAELATILRIMVDPRDLTIAAYELTGPMLDKLPSFLRPVDVRELSNMGLIVDSSDEFIELEDVIKVKQVYDYGFDLMGLEVIDENKKKLGKVIAYNVDSASFSVQQIVVKRPLLRSFNETELLINRDQVIEIRNTFIKVKSASVFKNEPVSKTAKEYMNPFRATNAQPEAIESETNWY